MGEEGSKSDNSTDPEALLTHRINDEARGDRIRQCRGGVTGETRVTDDPKAFGN